jgi:transcriptional regulator with XRE-family HTH domain
MSKQQISNSTHQVKHMEANKPQSQAEFFDGMFESSDDKAAFREFTEKRLLVSKLASLRATAGLTQTELAKQSDCVQATISKLESGVDSEVTVANIEAYAKATGFEITILISQRGKSLAEEIKHHARCIREAFMQLVKLAHMDNLIAQGVAQLHAEAFQNINSFLSETAQQLPVNEDNGRPLIQIVGGASPTNECSKSTATRKRQPESKRQNRRKKTIA